MWLNWSNEEGDWQQTPCHVLVVNTIKAFGHRSATSSQRYFPCDRLCFHLQATIIKCSHFLPQSWLSPLKKHTFAAEGSIWGTLTLFSIVLSALGTFSQPTISNKTAFKQMRERQDCNLLSHHNNFLAIWSPANCLKCFRVVFHQLR